jgi:hypothetical protein
VWVGDLSARSLCVSLCPFGGPCHSQPLRFACDAPKKPPLMALCFWLGLHHHNPPAPMLFPLGWAKRRKDFTWCDGACGGGGGERGLSRYRERFWRILAQSGKFAAAFIAALFRPSTSSPPLLPLHLPNDPFHDLIHDHDHDRPSCYCVFPLPLVPSLDPSSSCYVNDRHDALTTAPCHTVQIRPRVLSSANPPRSPPVRCRLARPQRSKKILLAACMLSDSRAASAVFKE